MFKVYEFHWRAENRFQQKQKGKLLAFNLEDAERKLQQKGYQHIQLKRNFAITTKPKFEEITQILSQLALLLHAAIPLKTALKMVQESCYQCQLYQWLNAIIQQIETGIAFSAALENQANYLTVQDIQLIKMAEKMGNLSVILRNIAESRLKSEKLTKKVKKILSYPVMILFISLSLSLLLLIFIVPQFAELYQGKAELPFITEMLFMLSTFLRNNGILLSMGSVIGIIVLVLLARKTALFTSLKFQLLSHFPLFSTIISHARIVFFCQNLALMLQSHLRLDTALRSFLAEKSPDPILQKEVEWQLTLLKQGYLFSEGLNPMRFDAQVIQMIYIGEKSGRLAEMLAHIADIYQQKLDYQVDILSQLLEPMLMLVIGSIIGTILMGLYLPIFNMGAMVG